MSQGVAWGVRFGETEKSVLKFENPAKIRPAPRNPCHMAMGLFSIPIARSIFI
jgi:hypothetical protein